MGCAQASSATVARGQQTARRYSEPERRRKEDYEVADIRPDRKSTSSWSLSHDDFFGRYSLGKKLGQGAFAQVHATSPRGSPYNDQRGPKYAVKIVDLRDRKKGTALKVTIEGQEKAPVVEDASKSCALKIMDAKQEVAVWSAVMESRNNHCIRFIEAFWGEMCCFLVMERCDTKLLEYLSAPAVLTEGFLAKIFRQMAKALEGLHRINVIHRDVKPDNFMLHNGVVKLGDFGLSVISKNGVLLNRAVGTAPYMSPEMLTVGKYNEKTDVWSLGVLMYVLLYGHFPYRGADKNSKSMRLAIRTARGPPSFRLEDDLDGAAYGPSPAMEATLRNVLVRDPLQRVTSSSLVRSPVWDLVTSLEEDEAEPACFRPMLHSAILAGAFSAAGLANDGSAAVDRNATPRNSKALATMMDDGHCGTASWMTRQTTAQTGLGYLSVSVSFGSTPLPSKSRSKASTELFC